MRFLRQALEGFGFIGVVAFGREGAQAQLAWLEAVTRALRPGEVQDDKEANECKQDELIDKMMRPHSVAPSNVS